MDNCGSGILSIGWCHKCFANYLIADKKVSGKSKDEQMAEKKQELEKRLQDVTGQLGSGVKKTAKKGER
jgi:tartrate dehydratase alpha subunit/fumarate hydratase class I-like protein